MATTDRWLGLALALLAGAVLWSARDFPTVPGQDVGAAFLPMLVGAGLLVCGAGTGRAQLSRQRLRRRGAAPRPGSEHFGSAIVVIGAIVFYIALSDQLGFLIVAPLCLVAVFKAMRVRHDAGPAVGRRRHADRAPGLLQAAARAAALGPAAPVLLIGRPWTPSPPPSGSCSSPMC